MVDLIVLGPMWNTPIEMDFNYYHYAEAKWFYAEKSLLRLELECCNYSLNVTLLNMNSYQPAIEKQNNINIGLNSYSERAAAEAISPI